eukprot:14638850-Heterocapsa_arctica.AAC.2
MENCDARAVRAPLLSRAADQGGAKRAWRVEPWPVEHAKWRARRARCRLPVGGREWAWNDLEP